METLYRAGLSNAVSASVLALVVACLGRLLGRRPAVMHCLWLLVLLKLVTPPLYEVPIPWSQTSSDIQQTLSTLDVGRSEVEAGTARSLHPADVVLDLVAGLPIAVDSTEVEPSRSGLGGWDSIDWMRLACMIWIGGAVTTLAVSAGRIRRFQRLLGDSRPASADMEAGVKELAASLGLDRSPSVCWTDGTLPPLVWSLGRRPRMIIPTALWNSLDDSQRSTLIIHELAHLRRGDHHVRIFELLVTALYWWHPVLWWARQALRDVEEQCCDAWVVWARPGAAKSYAETLLETLDFLNQSDLSEPLLASGFGRVHHLRKRLTMIMSGTTPRLLGFWGTLGSFGLAAVLLPVNATWAQKPEDRREVRIVVKTEEDVPEIVTLDEEQQATTITATVGTVAEPESGEIHLELKTDDGPAMVVSGPIDDAIKKLKEQLDLIAKDANPSDKLKARKKALEQVVEQLVILSKKDKDAKVDAKKLGEKVKADKALREIIVRQIDENKKISAEKQAEIQKATERVKKLADELRSKQKELAEAKSKLAKLVVSKGRASTVTVHGDARLLKEMAPLMKKPSDTVDRRVEIRRDGEAGQKRIDELEKKLEKLLDEVASLKKDRAR